MFLWQGVRRGCRAVFAERLRKQESVLLVADAPGWGCAGFVQLYPCFSSVSAAPVLILDDLFVAPDVRRCGVGRALLEAARHVAEQRGAVQMSLATGRSNIGAQALYESLGWERDEIFYHYALALLGRARSRPDTC